MLWPLLHWHVDQYFNRLSWSITRLTSWYLFTYLSISTYDNSILLTEWHILLLLLSQCCWAEMWLSCWFCQYNMCSRYFTWNTHENESDSVHKHAPTHILNPLFHQPINVHKPCLSTRHTRIQGWIFPFKKIPSIKLYKSNEYNQLKICYHMRTSWLQLLFAFPSCNFEVNINPQHSQIFNVFFRGKSK